MRRLAMEDEQEGGISVQNLIDNLLKETVRDTVSNNYLLSVLTGKYPIILEQILTFHFPKGAMIWDCTPGRKLGWSPPLLANYEVYFTTPKQYDLFSMAPFDYPKKFDGIYYDPPYFVEAKAVSDKRTLKNPYELDHTFKDLEKYMLAIEFLIMSLKSGGKILIKCADQYVPKKRRFYPFHVDWILHLREFGLNVVDFFVCPYMRNSPTAWQVKERPCAIIKHTYYIVGQKI